MPRSSGVDMKGGKSKADAPKKADSKLSVKSKGTGKPSSRPAKGAKAGKDPNKPKRPASAFFVFMEEFREQYKKKNPNVKQVSVVGKAGGVKWKSMSDADKASYVAKANKLKAEYDKKMVSYNKKESVSGNKKMEEDDEEESDKSKSEVNNDDEEEGSDEEGEDDDEE